MMRTSWIDIECGQWESMTVDALEGTKGENKKRKRTTCGFRLYTFAL